jgi:hypothetical protein
MYLLQLDFCLYCFYVYIAFLYKQVEPPEDFVMSLRAETKAGYLSSRASCCELTYYSCSNPVAFIKVGRSPLYASPYCHQSNDDMGNVHIASAHGTRQSRPIGVNNNPCCCRSQTTASTTCPHGLSRRIFQPPLDLSLRHLENSYPFIVELY